MPSPSLDAVSVPNRTPVYRSAAIWCGIAVVAALIAFLFTWKPLDDAATTHTSGGAVLVLLLWTAIIVWFLSSLVALILAIIAIARARDPRSRLIAVSIAVVCVLLIRASELILSQT